MSQPKVVTKEDLYQLHIIEGKALSQIEKLLGVSRPTLKKNLLAYGIAHNKTNKKKESPPREDLIRLHHDEEKTLKEIAKIYNTSQGKMTQWFKEHGIEVIDRQKIQVPLKEELEELYNTGMTFVELGRKYDTSNVTVRNWFKNYDMVVRNHQENQKHIMKRWASEQNIFPSQRHISKSSLEILNNKEKFVTEFNKSDNRIQFAKTLGVSLPLIEGRIRTHDCRSEIKKLIHTSISEQEMCDFLRRYLNIESNTRKVLYPKELDAYSEDLKLAFEFCGLYWHNELSPEPRGKYYHYEKFENCKKLGIRLITILEDEWVHRLEQVKGFLQSIVAKPDKIFYARKCRVFEINQQMAKDFLNLYHIQGKPKSILYAYGLLLDGELLGVMTFSKHHRKVKNSCNSIVLNRLAFAKGILVVGGASKLLKYAIRSGLKGYDTILSWSDNRWSWGNVYEKMGFTKEEELPPDYSYVDLNQYSVRYSKQSKQKRLIGCKPGQTEYERCKELGLARIWDCGKIRWGFPIQTPSNK